MSAKAVREATGKSILNKQLSSFGAFSQCQFATVESSTNWDTLVSANPWLTTSKLVVKPDQLIKRRGKLGLIKVNADLPTVKEWVKERMDKEIKVSFLLKIAQNK